MAIGEVLPDERHHLALRLIVTGLVLLTAASTAGLAVGLLIDRVVDVVQAVVISSP